MPTTIGSIAMSSAAPATTVDRPMPRSGPVRLLAAVVLLCLPFLALSIVDAGGLRVLWDNVHWSVSALGAALVGGWSIRSTVGRVRSIRLLGTAWLVIWLLATIAWAGVNLSGDVGVPSLADLFIVVMIVPGVGLLVASIRGRLSSAETTAVYLDSALCFVFVGSLLIFAVGPKAISLPAGTGIAAMLYPAIFLGLAASGLIAVLAVGYPIALRGAFAIVLGSAIIGVAYLGWIASAFDLVDPGELTSACFTIGPLVAAWGIVTWDEGLATGPRYLARARGATRILAPTVASLLFLMIVIPAPDAVATILRLAIFAASIVFIIRQGLLLRERTTMLSAVQTLTDENGRLVDELRAELARRAVDERRMIQASRSAAVGDLAAGVAHEVNNPLTGVLGFAEILIEESAPDDPRRADLETIRDEALRARNIVRALRDFANPRPPELAETDLSALVHQTVDLVRYTIEHRGIAIEEDLADLPPILIDGSAVQQAVLNILTNARQAMDGDGLLRVAVRADGDGRLITISDDGVGMDATTARLAFDPFFSGRADPTEPEPAAGLGLSVSHGLIQSHGGTIRIESLPGRGTTVEIRLPAGPEADLIGERQGGKVA
jgi:signal transduction histidine kinase